MRLTVLLSICVPGLAAPHFEGINCHGGFSCSMGMGFDRWMIEMEARLAYAVSAGHGGRVYQDGAHIACNGDACTFFQKASGSVYEAYQHVQNLRARGCKNCGSDPTHPGGDVRDGMLTVNDISTTYPCWQNSVDGLCPRACDPVCPGDKPVSHHIASQGVS